MRYDNIAKDMNRSPNLILDTNILVAATRNSMGPSFALLQHVRQSQVQLLCSPALFLEYETVLKRTAQLQASGLCLAEVDAILNELARFIEPVTTHYQWRPQLRDPADEMVLEAAVNGRAQAIVTYNLRDFAPAKLFGMPVINPQQAFALFDLPYPPNFPPALKEAP